MSILSDIRHLRERGFWPGNIVPQWALDASVRLGVPHDAQEVLAEGAVYEAVRFQTAAQDRQQELNGLLGRDLADYKQLIDAVTPRRFTDATPPIGPTLFVAKQGAIGIARWTDQGTLNVLWSEPPGASNFRAWIDLSRLSGR